MKSIAYLVLVLDTSVSPPVVLGASIFGETEPTLGAKRRCFTVLSAPADTYDEACEQIIKAVDTHPFFAWVKPIFRNRDGSNHFAPDAQTSDGVDGRDT